VTPPATPGDEAERELEQATRKQRHRDQQAKLAIRQVEPAANQRQSRALGAVSKLIYVLDGKRDSDRSGREQTAELGIAARMAAATVRSTSHDRHANRLHAARRSRPPPDASCS
jgi:hypothetical protein